MQEFDNINIWHPYSKTPSEHENYLVNSAAGVYLDIENHGRVIDGMSSWWACIHGYNNPTLNAAITTQLTKMAHVMFGGLTHKPAIELAKTLVDITPKALDKVFFVDSGSVAVEVALKMSLQYWHNKSKINKNKFITIRGGYHGDTFGAMSVCDPDNGMHHLFNGVLPQHLFVKRPNISNTVSAINDLKNTIIKNHDSIAAMILEPIVQGAGGMNIYQSEYLIAARKLCDEFNILLIFDEIATGFGRTGKLFAMEHANVTPDILCIGKALTGGYMTLAATLTSAKIAKIVGTLMHGPTFMANPLACCVANASINLLLNNNWQDNIIRIQTTLNSELLPLKDNHLVNDVRVLGAIGIVELNANIDVQQIQKCLISNGVWLRPYGKLLYTMPAFTINKHELLKITDAINIAINNLN